MMDEMTFEKPEYLYLLLFLPFIAWLYNRYFKKLHASFVFPLSAKATHKQYLTEGGQGLLLALRILTVGLLILALANPQSARLIKQTLPIEGIDIVLALDVSKSMLAEDLKPNRVEALKAVATNFVAQRTNDRLGLVIYAGESYTSCPLTTSHAEVIEHIQAMSEVPLSDGTAIGLGLSTAINRLRESKAKSKVIILMTDGENNAGHISPRLATQMAVKSGLKVYTVGVGTRGKAPYPTYDLSGNKIYRQVPVSIDTVLLNDIAAKTAGYYYRADDNRALEKIYADINQLEKSAIKQKEVLLQESRFGIFAFIASLLLVLELLLKHTVFKSPL